MESGGVMQLGGSIELIGFNGLEKAQLYVLKKIIGNHARKISEASKFDKFSVKLAQEGDECKINVEVTGDSPKKSEEKGKNLFVVLDQALKKVI